MNGRFIVLEGPDGSGTTSHTGRLVETLQTAGYDVLQTFEATDGPIGTSIRQELRSGGLPAAAMQLLFCADRAWHVEKVIRPALEAGKIVVCDRYSLSTEVYGEAFGVDREWLHQLNKKFIQPDLQLLALPPLSVCLERLTERDMDTFEANTPLQQTVYGLYAAEATHAQSGTVFDTSGDFEETASKIFERVKMILA